VCWRRYVASAMRGLVDSFGFRPVAVCLGSQAITAGGLAVLLGGMLVGGGFADMGGLCTFVDLGGSLV
jgi:hypothetical protein